MCRYLQVLEHAKTLNATFLVLMSCSVAGVASLQGSEAIENGAAYLESIQNADGSWTTGSKKFVDSVECFKALHGLKRPLTFLKRTGNYLAQIESTDNDKRARILSVVAYSTTNPESLILELLSVQRADGGWGLSPHKQSSSEDTIYVLDALLRARCESTSALGLARDYLVARQDSSGGWLQEQDETQAALPRTAYALIVLKALEARQLHTSASTAAVQKAKGFLETRLNAALNETTVLALTSMALGAVKPPDEIKPLIDALLASQLANGAWKRLATDATEDVHSTALALQALRMATDSREVEKLTDILVTSNAISFNPALPLSGAPVQVSVTVFNTSDIEARNVEIALFKNDPRAGGGMLAAPQQIAAMAAQTSVTLTFQFDSTGFIGSGEIFVAADFNNTIKETNETNNLASRTLVIDGKADLAISSSDLSVGLPAASGPQTTEFVVRVRNEGTLSAPNVLVRVQEDGVVKGEFNVTTIPARSTYILSFALALEPGDHALTAVVDPAATVEEISETNNQATLQVSVQAQNRADLTVLPVDIQISNTTPLPGQIVTVSATVRNNGTSSSGAFKVLFVRGDPFVGAELIQSFDIIDVAAGRHQSLSTEYVSPLGLSQIYVIADSGFQVAESSEANNIAFSTLHTLSLPDLRVTLNSVTLSHTNLDLGLTVKATIQVDNVGSQAASACDVRLNLEKAGIETVLGQKSLGALVPGQSTQTDFFFQPGAGAFNIKLQADPQNVLAELNEVNNLAVKSVEFTVSALTIGVFREGPGGRAPESIFDAVELVILQPVYVQTAPDISISLEIVNEFGEQFAVRPQATNSPTDPHDIFEFPTAKNKPGRYTVRAQAKRRTGPNEFQVLTQAQKDFIIRPTERLTAVTPFTNPKTAGKGTRTLALFTQIGNASNVDVPVTIKYDVIAPSGTVVLTNSIERQLSAANTIETLAIQEITREFTESGPYRLKVAVLKDAVQIGSGSGTFQIEGALRLQAVRTITPSTLPPSGSGTVNVKIKVEAVENNDQ